MAMAKHGRTTTCGPLSTLWKRRGNRYARRFQPAYSKKEYYSHLVKRGGLSASEMVKVEAVALAASGDQQGMDALIHELEEIIEEYRRRDDDAK